MMKNYIVIAVLSLVGLSACDLQERPTSYYAQETYFTTEAKAKMAVIGAYSGPVSYTHLTLPTM